MKQYKFVNNLTGWITFFIAATVYCLTIEPTASFWDCPEFITTGYKLEVGHPPGAPFFMLVANFFSLFASGPSEVARMVNYMSALMSGACILFLFWSITHLVRKLVVKDENHITRGQMATIMGSGVVGALAYTFSDTFWFSAVEGEVYAFSSLFTAIVFWLILKWEDVADQPHSDRWLILIAYLTGLSIGVHLLNLLCLPAIVLVYYYKKVPNANARGSLLALIGSAVLVAVVLYGIVPGIVKVGGWFELLFVNTLGMPFNTGVIVYIILLAACLIWGVYESYTEKDKMRMAISFVLTIAMLGIPFYGHGAGAVVIGIIVIALLWLYLNPKTQDRLKEKYRVSARTLNTALLCTMMMVIGYSSYALIVIRSTANTPMDQNSPEDIFTLGEYLGREQYGTRPLFYGPAYTSKVALDVKDGYCQPRISYNGTKFIRKEKATPEEKDSYIEIPGRVEYEYAQNMLFPRMYSSTHTQQYEAWGRQGLRSALRPVRRNDHGEDAYAVGEHQVLLLLSAQLDVLALLHVELCGPTERHPGLRRDRARQLDHGHRLHRQPAHRRPDSAPHRPEGEQGTQCVLWSAVAARHHRPAVASLPRTEGNPAVLDRVLPVLHDGYRHRTLPEPDSQPAA